LNKCDEKWVSKQIATLPNIEYKKVAWQGYKNKYTAAFNGETNEHKKENKAGFVANCALRAFINKVHNVK
jgi:hypothetical protein